MLNPTKKITEAKSSSAKVMTEYTFCGSAYGSTDIVIKASKPVNVTIYKKKKKIKTFKNIKKKTYNIKKYSSKNTYKLKVTVHRTKKEVPEIISKYEDGKSIDEYFVDVKCNIKSHQDVKKGI